MDWLDQYNGYIFFHKLSWHTVLLNHVIRKIVIIQNMIKSLGNTPLSLNYNFFLQSKSEFY